MSDELVFSMTKRRLAAFTVCICLAIVILYLAGVVTGLLIAPVNPKTASTRVVSIPKETVKTNAVPTGPDKPSQEKPASQKLPTGDAATPTGLSVQVASFLDRDRAERFAASLKRQGFDLARVDEIASAEQTWHVVRLGPYHDWDSASQVAAEIGRSYDLHCSVRPL
jgi:cell division septation protein DedD